MLSRLLRKSVAKTKAQTRRSVQHSPFNQNIVNTKELRSEIFASRRRIPGRKVKFLVLISTAGFIFGQAKFREINGYFQLREQEQTRLQRRSVPFFQAMDDLRWMALEDRLSLVNEALFQDKSKEWFDSVTKRYHFQEDQFWSRYVYKHAYQQQGAPRQVVPYSHQFGFRICHGYEIPNI